MQENRKQESIPAPPFALTIAGSDSGGGAGVQQDIRVFSILGVQAGAVITALTAQNSLGVQDIMPVPPGFVRAQLEAVMSDMRPGFIKCGMLLTASNVKAIEAVLKDFPGTTLVIDTVMLSKNGAVLLDQEGQDAMKELLFPLASLITPNVPEAEVLSGIKIDSPERALEAARKIQEQANHASVLVKGGHLPGDEATDILLHHGEVITFRAKRMKVRHTHGTGCTLSSAVTALLAHGLTMEQACRKGVELTRVAIGKGFPLGAGTGPLDIFSWNGALISQHGTSGFQYPEETKP